jgi:2-polyprenyl-3-methyl-5-hydroxy-6-metoxy-1,4-benzoquinol methylase
MDREENPSEEKKFVESLVDDYITSDESSQTRLMRDLMIRVFKPFIHGGHALELGSEIGYMSERLSPLVDTLDIVDGSQEFLDQVRKRHLPNAHYFCSLFEEYRTETVYDLVIGSHILEHLKDVQLVVTMVKRVLAPSGLFLVTVPNARAMSRQLARHMGILEDLYELTPNDIRGGHRRVYDRVTLIRDLELGGFEIIAQGGILFKPLADFQMDKLLDLGILGPEQTEGLFRLGHEYPDLCADIFAIARPTP